jgi:hypothetical protein
MFARSIHRAAAATSIALGLSLVFGCSTASPTGGDDSNDPGVDPGDPTSPGNPGNPSTSGGGGSCCLNSVHYVCADKAAFDKCAGFDIFGCFATCSDTDFDCRNRCSDQAQRATNDPSACTKSNEPCPSTSSSGGAGCVKSASCTISADCGSGQQCNSRLKKCFDPSKNCKGVACDISADCSSGKTCNTAEHKCN